MRPHRHHPTTRRLATALTGLLLLVAVACGGDDGDSAGGSPAAANSDTTTSTTVAVAPWEADAQAVLDGAIGPDGLPISAGDPPQPNPAGGATLGVQLADGSQYVLTTGVDTDNTPVEADGTFLLPYLTRTPIEMAAWELVDEGDLDLDEPIATWFPQVAGAEDITLRMILDRSSGMGELNPALQDALIAEPDRAWTLAEAVDAVADVPLLAEPGTYPDYDEGPGLIVAAVMEEVTGRSLAALVDQYVVDPLGLETMSFATLEDLPTEGGTILVDADGPLTLDEAGQPEAYLTAGAPLWGLQADMADLLAVFDALSTGTLPGPDQAPSPSAFAGRYAADRDLAFGVGTPLVAYCPCTGGGDERIYSSFGRTGATVGSSMTIIHFPDTGTTMAIRLNASFAEGPDMRRVLYEVHDLITAS